MTWGRGGASPARQRGAPGPGVAGTPRPQPRLAPRPRTRAHHSPPAASPSPLRLRLQGKSRPPGLGVCWAASASQGGERAGAEPREPPPSRTRKPHSQAARPGSPATHPSPLLSEGRAQTRPFLSSGRDGLVPASCTHASHGGHTDSPRDRAAQTSGSGRFAPRPPRTRQRLSTWDHLPTHAPTRIYRTGNENQEKL